MGEPRDDISEERTGSEPSATKIQQLKAAEPPWPSSPSSTSPLVDSDAGGVAAVAMQTDDDLSVLGATSTLWRQIQTPGGVTTLLIVFSYKFGEAVSDNMFKPYLLDQGFTKAQISMWTGVYGMGFSTAGSLAGGFVVKKMVERQARRQQEQEQKQVRESQDQSLTSDGIGKQKHLSSAQQNATERKGIAGATKESEDAAAAAAAAAAATAAAGGGGGGGGGSNTILLSAVTLASAFEALAQLGRFVAACATTETLSSEHGQLAFQTLIMYESFCGGLLTTIIFTYMMASVDKSIGATHYSMLSTVELAGKSIPSITSGLLAEALGYQYVFALGAGCSVLFVLFALGVTLRTAAATTTIRSKLQ